MASARIGNVGSGGYIPPSFDHSGLSFLHTAFYVRVETICRGNNRIVILKWFSKP